MGNAQGSEMWIWMSPEGGKSAGEKARTHGDTGQQWAGEGAAGGALVWVFCGVCLGTGI